MMKLGSISRKRVHPATRKPTTRDLEWAAGFLEGEACFRRTSTSENISVSQVDAEPVVRLLEIFGGRALKLPRIQPHNDVWIWSISGARARGVMLTLYSLLGQRRKQQIQKALKSNVERVEI